MRKSKRARKSVRISSQGAGQTLQHGRGVVGASRDERTSDRSAHARWMHAIPTHARARDRMRASKASSPTRQRRTMVSAMDDVEALDTHARQRYVPQPCPRTMSTRPRGKSTGDQCQLPAFVKFHPVSRGAEELARSIDRSIDRGRFSTLARARGRPRLARRRARRDRHRKTNHTKYIDAIPIALDRRRRARTSAASRMYVSSAHSITVLPSGPSRVTEYLALIAERGAAVRRATVDVRTAENAEAVTAVEEIVKADIVVVNVREVVRRRRDYSLTPRTHARPIYPTSSRVPLG